MPKADVAAFVAEYQDVRRANDSAALGRLWDPDGRLEHPNLSRPIRGSQPPAFNDLTLARLPDLTWQLLDWAARDSLVYLEWRCHATVAGTELAWSGVDRMVLDGGSTPTRSDHALWAPSGAPSWLGGATVVAGT